MATSQPIRAQQENPTRNKSSNTSQGKARGGLGLGAQTEATPRKALGDRNFVAETLKPGLHKDSNEAAAPLKPNTAAASTLSLPKIKEEDFDPVEQRCGAEPKESWDDLAEEVLGPKAERVSLIDFTHLLANNLATESLSDGTLFDMDDFAARFMAGDISDSQLFIN